MFNKIKYLVHFFSVSLLLLACGQSSLKRSQALVKDCILPEDQAGTLTGRWKAYPPIPLAFATGEFSLAEMKAIADAADEWNAFTVKSLGGFIFSYQDPLTGTYRQSSTPKPSFACSSSSIVQAQFFSGSVIIYKSTVWDPTRMDVIAQTNYCPLPDQPVPMFEMAFIELNFQDFFVSGKRAPDLKSIAVHELGHLIGLNHSCDAASQGIPGMPYCGTSPRDYLVAVMYPVIQFIGNQGSVRTQIQKNDQGRTNCLYLGIISP